MSPPTDLLQPPTASETILRLAQKSPFYRRCVEAIQKADGLRIVVSDADVRLEERQLVERALLPRGWCFNLVYCPADQKGYCHPVPGQVHLQHLREITLHCPCCPRR